MRRAVMLSIALLLLCGVAPASANTPDSFTACAKKRLDAPCRTSIAVLAGKTVYLRGKVVPPHAELEAELWHRGPDLQTEIIATVPISAEGKLKFEWTTTNADGSQTDPNWFRFRIPGHGKSNDVEVMVFLGE